MDQETQRLLGQLIGRLESIENTLKTANQESKESRTAVYGALREIREEAQDTRHRLDQLEQVVTNDVQPVVRGVLDWRSRAIGAATVLGLVGTALMFFITATKDLISAAWQALLGR